MRSRVSADLGKAGLCLVCATGALLIPFHFNGLTTESVRLLLFGHVNITTRLITMLNISCPGSLRDNTNTRIFRHRTSSTKEQKLWFVDGNTLRVCSKWNQWGIGYQSTNLFQFAIKWLRTQPKRRKDLVLGSFFVFL